MAIVEQIKPPRTSDPKEIDRFYRAVAEKLNSLLTAPTWTEVSAFSNSWTNFGGTFDTAGYCKDIQGFVHLKGVIKDGTVGSSAFTLPTGYRPASQKTFAVVTASEAHGCVYVNTSGDVVPISPTVNTYVWIDGITFYAG